MQGFNLYWPNNCNKTLALPLLVQILTVSPNLHIQVMKEPQNKSYI
jgi:hypothetical protein